MWPARYLCGENAGLATLDLDGAGFEPVRSGWGDKFAPEAGVIGIVTRHCLISMPAASPV